MLDILPKSPAESKTIIAAVVTLLASIGGLAGITLSPEEQGVLIGAGTAVVTAVGAVVAIIGRVKATQKVGK